MIDRNRITYLLKKAAEQSAGDAELLELMNMLKSDESLEVTAEIEALLKQYQTTERVPLTVSDTEALTNAVLRADHATGKEPAKVITLWKKIAVAACILLTFSTGAYFLFFNKKQEQIIAIGNKNDVAAPKINKAMITLSNGKQIVLDSAGNGTIATQSNVSVIKTSDGKIVYESTVNGQQSTVQYNTLSNPRGSQVVNLTLADGSKVWLNAASSLKYPTSFVGNERKVEITGEAYFEVAHNASMPFKVSKGETEVTVLGTHFNVNTYDDEAEMKVTLLEGSVKVATVYSPQSTVIKPGQQAQVNLSADRQGSSSIRVINGIDVDEVMAWKNGLFSFSNADLQTVLRQVARWYDVEVTYEGTVPKREFKGEIQRNLNLSEVLKILEKNNVHFKIDGKKIVVTP